LLEATKAIESVLLVPIWTAAALGTRIAPSVAGRRSPVAGRRSPVAGDFGLHGRVEWLRRGTAYPPLGVE
jgi:hypothetical protein